MALWMRGGKDWSWTLHLQSAQWVVLVTTSFSRLSPFLSSSWHGLLMLLISSTILSFPSFFFLQLLARFDLSQRPLALPLCSDLSGFSFAFTFPSLFFNLSKAIYSWELLGGVGFCSQTLLSWEKQWIIRSRRCCAWRVAVRVAVWSWTSGPREDCHLPNRKCLLDY